MQRLTILFDAFIHVGIEVQHIPPGKPSQNGYIERFNRTYRQDVLNAYLFEDMIQVRILTEE